MQLQESLSSFNTLVWKNWKSLITLAFLIILITGLTLILAGRNHLYDPSLYHQYAQNIFAGKRPYCDFKLEYPPLALLPMVIPQFLTLGKTTHLYVYSGIFALQILVYALISVLVLARFKAKSSSEIYPIQYLLSQGIFLIILAPLLLWRYDLFPGLVWLLALVSASSFPVLAGILMGIGFAAKLYPILGIPLFVIFYGMKRRFVDLKNFLIGLLSMISLAIVPFLFKCPVQLSESIQFHQLRGLQIESLPANLLLIGHHVMNFKIEVVKNFGAEHLKTPLAEPLLKIFPIIFVILYVGSVLNFIRLLKRDNTKLSASKDLDDPMNGDLNLLIGYSILAIALFIITNKVFSPQYLMWLAPLAPLLSRKLQKTFLLVCLAHVVVYPFLYDALVEFQVLPIAIISFGNLFMIYFAFQLFKEYEPNLNRVKA